MGVNIGQAAKASGLSERMIRYFEKQGVVPKPARSAGGYRSYSDDDVKRMRTIALAQDAGFSTDAIVRLIAAMEAGRSDPDVEAEAMAQLDRAEEAVAELRGRIDDMKDRARSRLARADSRISAGPRIEVIVHRDGARPDAPCIERVSLNSADPPSAETRSAHLHRDLTLAD